MRTISRVHASGNLPPKSELRPDATQGDETLAGKANAMLLESISSGRERACKRARCKERCDSIMGHLMCPRCGCSPTNPRETMHEMLKRRPDAEPFRIMPIPDAASVSLDEAIRIRSGAPMKSRINVVAKKKNRLSKSALDRVCVILPSLSIGPSLHDYAVDKGTRV